MNFNKDAQQLLSDSIRIQEVVDALPNEDSLKIDGVSADAIEAIVDRFFEGKTPPYDRNQARVEILNGGPGSGKSYSARKRYEALSAEEKASSIYVSYDETGAIYVIPEYRAEVEAILGRTFDEHESFEDLSDEQHKNLEDTWQKYRPLSQRIRAQILKRAVQEGHNLIIDTTSSSGGTIKLIEALQRVHYRKENMTVEAMYAPLEQSEKRIGERARPAEQVELITKRIGALSMIEPLIDAVGTFRMRYNPDNENEPQEAFVFEGGHLVKSDPSVVEKISASFEADVDVAADIVDNKLKRAILGDFDRDSLVIDLADSCNDFDAFLAQYVLDAPSSFLKQELRF